MNRKDILDRLNKMDMEAYATIGAPQNFRMVIVGGSGLVLLDTIDRATRDIDAIDASAKIRGLMEKYGANLDVSAYMHYFPYNYESRLHKLDVGGRKVDFYTASLEDIVIAKLFSERPQDRQDIISDEVRSKINWDILHRLATDENEVKASVLNERSYRDFLYNYNEYVRRYGPDEGVDL
ncbi:MAG: hypothetical protein IJR90_08610 [Clostridia bacterium]|nr:hypothetical protein [Clostridia bacterium]